MYEESKFLEALVQINSDDFNEKQWLLRNFQLYKKTLNWPNGLPPVRLTNITKGSLEEKFHLTYYKFLSNFENLKDNKNKTIEIVRLLKENDE